MMGEWRIPGCSIGPYHRPHEIWGEFRLSRYKDPDYFIFFGSVFLSFSLLILLPGSAPSYVVVIWFACLICTIIFGLFMLSTVTTGTILWDAIRILVADTGLYIENRKGEITFILLFSRIDKILYWYDNEDPFPTETLAKGDVLPATVVFEIIKSRGFWLPLRYILESDQKKFLELLSETCGKRERDGHGW